MTVQEAASLTTGSKIIATDPFGVVREFVVISLELLGDISQPDVALRIVVDGPTLTCMASELQAA